MRPAARLLKHALEKLSASTSCSRRKHRRCRRRRIACAAVVLDDGARFDCEPRRHGGRRAAGTALARSAGLQIGRGIVVDDKLADQRSRRSTPSANAPSTAASATAWWSRRYEQARVLARHLAGLAGRYAGSLLATSLKVSGVPVFSIGDFEGEGAEADPARRHAGRRLPQAGAARRASRRRRAARRYGDALWYRELIRLQAPDRCAIRARPRLRQGLRGGRAAEAHERATPDDESSDEQRRYLEGFVSGVQAQARRPGPQAARRAKAAAAQPVGARQGASAAMARFEAAGKKLSAEEKAKREEHPFDAYARLKAESANGQFPKGDRQLPLALPRPLLSSRRRRTPTCAACASPTAS